VSTATLFTKWVSIMHRNAGPYRSCTRFRLQKQSDAQVNFSKHAEFNRSGEETIHAWMLPHPMK
jgi:hypothetical protein